jgi:hypothetical protein
MSAEHLSLTRLHRLVASRKGGKGTLRQWLEMAGLFLLHGNGPGFYQMGGFWRAGQPWSTMAGHYSYRQYQAQLDQLNPKPYRKLSQNKIAEKAILTMMGIPTPRMLGLLDPKKGRTPSGAPLRTASDLVALLSAECIERVCFKEVEGHGGRGFTAVEIVRHDGLRFRLLGSRGASADTLTADDLIAPFRGEQRIVMPYIDQHPDYAAFNPTSVNTLRIWVLHQDGVTRTRLAFLRMGRGGSVVDNRSAGGIVAPVDLSTGRLSEGLDGRPRRETYRVHPDHGAPIEGVVLPNFAEAKALAELSLGAFPFMNFAGVDVAMSPAGPVILELNVQADRSGAVHVGIPSKRVFER